MEKKRNLMKKSGKIGVKKSEGGIIIIIVDLVLGIEAIRYCVVVLHLHRCLIFKLCFSVI